MFDVAGLANKVGGNAIDKYAGNLNSKATPINSFISKINSTLGTNFSQINPSAMLKAAASGQISSLFGGKENANSPVRTTGKAFASLKVANELDKRLDPITNFEWIAMVVNKNPSKNTELPWYYIDEITIPCPNFGTTQKFVLGKDKKYAEWFTINTCTMKLYTDVSGLAFNFCNDWALSIYRDDNFYQMPIAYKKDIYVFILDPTRQVVVDIQLLGCWPSAWADYQLTGGSAAALESSITLNVDDFKMNYDVSAAAVQAKIARIADESLWNSVCGRGAAGIPSIVPGLSQLQNAVKNVQDTMNSVQNKVNSVLKF